MNGNKLKKKKLSQIRIYKRDLLMLNRIYRNQNRFCKDYKMNGKNN